tara:strand:+ start:42201 stop:42974 length:774 start_codon:yes stop_codon:yes gene_type:complete
MKNREQELKSFNKLLNIMDELRAKCPWDMTQTIDSLRILTIEETYELADAILNHDMISLKEELGDLLLHIVFYSRIASETSDFNITDVLNGICEKLISRHPHIYGDVNVKDDVEVRENWEKIKLLNGKKSLFEGVPKHLPSIIKCMRIQEKASGLGFDWDNTDQVLKKIEEELNEFKHEVKKNDLENMQSEFGDILFSIINLARHMNINPDSALSESNKKFMNRFKSMEDDLRANNRTFSNLTIKEMSLLWDRAKKK